MRRRAVVGLVGLAAIGFFAAGCGSETDVAAGRGPDTSGAPTDTAAEAGEPPGAGSSASLTVAEFDVAGMTCGGCALATEMAVEKLEGVTSADADYDEETGQGSCTVEYDPSLVTRDAIAGAIRGAGFEPRPRGSGSR